jgi:phosphatidylinositol glycan class Z
MKAALQHFPWPADVVSESYLVLVLPRLVVALLGLAGLCCVKKLSKQFGVDPNLASWYWCTSAAVWAFLTRSFSNSMETALLSVCVVLLVSMDESHNQIVLWRHKSSGKGESASSSHHHAHPPHVSSLVGAQKAYGKLKLCSFLLGFTLCLGLFNRPTFALFAAVPLLWWCSRLLRQGLFWKQELVSLYLTFCGCGFSFVLLTAANSAYYNPEFLHLLNDIYQALWEKNFELAMELVKLLSATVTIPSWNFIRFNMSPSNLEEHGLHPWCTHLAVNMPLLLGPLVLLVYWDVVKLMWSITRREGTDVLYAMVIIPVVLLSFFPHQEAR